MILGLWRWIRRTLRTGWVLARAFLFPAPRDRINMVYLFNEDPDDDSWFHMPLSRFSWWEVVQTLPELKAYRVEVRYTFRGRKYRKVLRQPDLAFEWPIALTPRFVVPVLSAELIPLGDHVAKIDITKRYFKYAGPEKTLTLTRARDMFPFDDHEDNAARFRGVRITPLFGTPREIPY